MKRTKIICTIGPATESKEKIRALVKAGMNVARLNFSHGSYENHAALIKNIRQVSDRLGEPLAVMQDLQGPRIRLGTLPPDGVDLKRGDSVALVYEGDIKKALIPKGAVVLPVQERLEKIVKKGERVFIKDGLVRLLAKKSDSGYVLATVDQGDILTSNRGINLPDSKLPDIVLTDKDKKDVKFGLQQQVDWIALSFVRDAKDIKMLRKLFSRTKTYAPRVIAKIERLEAVQNFDEILAAADGIMVARGDLGIELPTDEIPLIQKNLVAKCVAAHKPVVVATQMLESMTINPRPTRAEVSDVANAVIDRTDAVMLSGETATGKFPVEACQMMSDIIDEVERSAYDDSTPLSLDADMNAPILIARTVRDIVASDHIKAVVVMSSSGRSAQLIASERPETGIIALTQNEVTRRQMALIWGLRPHLMKRHDNLDDLIREAVKLVKKEMGVKSGERVVIASGHPTGPHGHLNLLKIQTV